MNYPDQRCMISMAKSSQNSFQSPFDPEELINLSSKAPSVSNFSHPENNERSDADQETYNPEPQSDNFKASPRQESEVKLPQTLKTDPVQPEGSEGVKMQNQQENPPNEERSKLDPNQIINLGGKQERKVGSVKSESQIWTGSPWQNQLPRRYKIRNRKTDNTSLRYQCFCSRQYLSYCATYQHMVRDHPDFLHHNKRFSSTNVIQTVDPIYGFKIKKIMRHRKKRKQGQPFIPGQNLSKRTKRRIREQSPHIQGLLKQLQECNLLRQSYSQKLKIYAKKMDNQERLISKYTTMISSYDKIIKVLDVQPIIEGLEVKPHHLEYDLDDINDEEYFPE